MTRVEACAELARRMGWEFSLSDGQVYVGQTLWNPFKSYASARALVRWFTQQDFHCRTKFLSHFLPSVNNSVARRMPGNLLPAMDAEIFSLLLTTPEEITLAACAALGIKVE